MGNDAILSGSGNGFISTAGGHNSIQLGSNTDKMPSGDIDTIMDGLGAATIITAMGSVRVRGGSGALTLTFTGCTGPSTVTGGSSSATIFAGAGDRVLRDGSGGNNLIFVGNGPSTVTGGKSGDMLYAEGAAGQVLNAGTDKKTLSSAFSAGNNFYLADAGADAIDLGASNDTVAASAGTTTVTVRDGTNTFHFTQGQAHKVQVINGFKVDGGGMIQLMDCRSNRAVTALAAAKVVGGSTTITLSDQTQVTFSGVASAVAWIRPGTLRAWPT